MVLEKSLVGIKNRNNRKKFKIQKYFDNIQQRSKMFDT